MRVDLKPEGEVDRHRKGQEDDSERRPKSEQEQERGHCGCLGNRGVGGLGRMAEAVLCGTPQGWSEVSTECTEKPLKDAKPGHAVI